MKQTKRTKRNAYLKKLVLHEAKKVLFKQNFKEALAIKTGCIIQSDGWTCGTCFYAISKKLNNADWRSLLYYRGDYNNLKEGVDMPKNYMSNIIKIWRLIEVEE